MKKLKKKRLIMLEEDCNFIMKLWNNYIKTYGSVSYAMYKALFNLKMEPNKLGIEFTDAFYGWTEMLTTKNFKKYKPIKTRFSLETMYELILPDPKLI